MKWYAASFLHQSNFYYLEKKRPNDKEQNLRFFRSTENFEVWIMFKCSRTLVGCFHLACLLITVVCEFFLTPLIWGVGSWEEAIKILKHKTNFPSFPFYINSCSALCCICRKIPWHFKFIKCLYGSTNTYIQNAWEHLLWKSDYLSSSPHPLVEGENQPQKIVLWSPCALHGSLCPHTHVHHTQ